MSDSIDRVFVKAINTIKALSARKGVGSLPPPPLESRIRLYGLYKQATEGDVEGLMPRPSGSTPEDAANRRKWDAWKNEQGVSKTEAKRRYIAFLIETMDTYASETPESRELLNDLEYLWDQVKDIQPSSSSDDSAAIDSSSHLTGVNPHPHHSPRSHAGSLADESVDASESGVALTAANLMEYNQQQQLQLHNSHKSRRHHPQASSYVGSYSSAGPQNATSSASRKIRGSSNRPSSRYPDSFIGAPPPLYRAESYISGSATSRAGDTVNTAAATGLGPSRRETSRKKYAGSDVNSVGESVRSTGRRSRKMKSSSAVIPTDNRGPELDDSQEFFDARATASGIRDSSRAAGTQGSSTDETNEMKRWRHDVNWALDTINEEIMAIRQRYGVHPLTDHDVSGGVGDQSNLPQGSRPGAHGKIPHSAESSQLVGKGANSIISDDSEVYKSSILYASILKARRMFAWFGIGTSPNAGYNGRKPSGETGLSSSYGSGVSLVSSNQNPSRQVRYAPGHPLSSSPRPHSTKSFILRVFSFILSALQRVVVDVIVIHILVTLAAKGITQYPHLLQNNDLLHKIVKTWDESLKRLMVEHLVKNITTKGYKPTNNGD